MELVQPLLLQLRSLPLRNLPSDIAQGTQEAHGLRLVIWFPGPEGGCGVQDGRQNTHLPLVPPQIQMVEEAEKRQSRKGRCIRHKDHGQGNLQTEGPTTPLRRKRRRSQTGAFAEAEQRQGGGCGGREEQAKVAV